MAVPGDGAVVHLAGQAVAEIGGLGALRLRGGLPLAVYQVECSPMSQHDPEPQPDDTSLERLEPGEKAAIEQAAIELGLSGLSTSAAMARIDGWFGKKFLYSLWQTPPKGSQGPLARFLSETHAGHCEYFATATVLLLRTAGIPSRYAVGFSMNERYDDRWIARGRDAHAWCLVWMDGKWQDFDTTPGTWREQEMQGRSWFEGISDRWSDLWLHFDLWRQEGGRWQLLVFFAGMLVLAWIAWRQLRGSAWRRVPAAGAQQSALELLGLDSEFMPVLDLLERREPRPRHLPSMPWLQTVSLPDGIERAQVVEALALHEQLRFDPMGLEPAQRLRLRVLSQTLNGLLTKASVS